MGIRGVERNTKKVFTIPVEKRDKETLLKNIKKYIKPQTKIITDCWKGYIDLKHNGYQHETVNHKKYFKDPITKACTNMIEGTWNGFKLSIKPQYRTKRFLYNHLLECQWRKKYYNYDIWEEIIKVIKIKSINLSQKYQVINKDSLFNKLDFTCTILI